MSKRSRIVRRRMRAIDRRDRGLARDLCIVVLEQIPVNHDHVLTWDMVRENRHARLSYDENCIEIRVPRMGKPTIVIQSIISNEVEEAAQPFILDGMMHSLEQCLRRERWGHMIPKPGASVRECREAQVRLLELDFDQRILYGKPIEIHDIELLSASPDGGNFLYHPKSPNP